MPPETTPESQQTTTFDEYSWIAGKNRAWDSVCVRIRADGRVYLGLKGYDKKRGGPGYIAVELTGAGLDELSAHLAEARAAVGDEEE